MTMIKKVITVLLCCVLTMTAITPISTEAAAISDVKSSNSKYSAIKWAVDNGIMQTFSNRKFQMYTLVTELQLLTMIAKLDSNYSYSYKNDMIYNYYSDLNLPVNGGTDAKKRNGNVTRGQFARIYAALNGYDLSEPQAVQYLYMNEITKGTNGKKTYADYNPNKKIARGELAVFLYRIAKNGGISSEGLTGTANGKDNNKISLPLNFISNGKTVNLEGTSSSNKNDISGYPNATNPVQNISVSTEELTANGEDAALIKIELKDSYGDPIAQDTSLQFRVESKLKKAMLSASPNSREGSVDSIIVESDGGELTAYVTAPALTKSAKDIITFELINNDNPKFSSYKDKEITVNLRYVPKPELRIQYKVYDPDQPDWTNQNAGSGNQQSQAPEFDEGDIDITSRNKEQENYTFTATHVGSQVKDDSVDYRYAKLLFENQEISPWLFEEILKRKDGEIGLENYPLKVKYSREDGVPQYEIYTSSLNDYPNNTLSLSAESDVILYLLGYIPDELDDVTLVHYDSIKKISAIFNKISTYEQNQLYRSEYSDKVSQIRGYESTVDRLKANEELAQRPEGMEKYTKVIVSLVAPGGQIITDYKGNVRITFNGLTRDVSFTTDTTDYVNNTGHQGAAVAYFDMIKYGKAEVTAEVLSLDERYKNSFKDLIGVEKSEMIFTNPRFEDNKCERDVEVAYVVDQSGSMKKIDPENYVAHKTKQLIEQIDATHNIAIRFNTKANIDAIGDAPTVSSSDIFKKDTIKGGTNIANGLSLALSNFTNDKLADDDEAASKSIILVSDGKTTKSQISAAIEKAKNLNVKIFTVAVGKQSETDLTVLKQLSTETGGQFFHITEIEMLHNVYQTALDAILCEDFVTDASCLNTNLIFTDAQMEIRRTNVIMTAFINTSCDNVGKVRVRFNSVHGEYYFDLIHRGENIFRAVQEIAKFEKFNLYDEIDFLAYDKDGNLIGTKTIRIQ